MKKIIWEEINKLDSENKPTLNVKNNGFEFQQIVTDIT